MSTSKVTTSKSASKKVLKASASEQGSSYLFEVKIICPQDNFGSGSWLYSVGSCSILFLDVSEVDFVSCKKKHYRAAGMLHSYDHKDEGHICEPTAASLGP